MQSLKIGRVVAMTKIEQRKVQIGSATKKVGHIIIMMAAITTPIDWIMSPRMCMNVAQMLTFPFSMLWRW